MRIRWVVFFLIASAALTPWTISVVRPYRMVVEVPMWYGSPTQVFVYHATNAKGALEFKPQTLDALRFDDSRETPPPLQLLSASLSSSKPFTGLRIDPADVPAQVRMGSVTLRSLTGAVDIGVDRLAPWVAQGQQLADVQRPGDNTLSFRTTGGDPYFQIPLAPELLNAVQPSRSQATVFCWALTLAGLLFVGLLAQRHALWQRSGDGGRLPAPRHAGVLQAWVAFALDFSAAVLFVYAMGRFVDRNTGMNFTHLPEAFVPDGVGQAVPIEVRSMKAIVLRHGGGAYFLAGDLGIHEDEGVIYQRATEYLYPARVVAHSRWVFSREGGALALGGVDCAPVDRQDGIVLYDCPAQR